MKIHYLRPLLVGALVLPVMAQAAWTLVDNFNDDDFSNVAITQTGPESELFAYPEPGNESNTGIFVHSGTDPEDYAQTCAVMDLPFSIGPGDVATLYWRLMKIGHDNVWHLALSDVDGVYDWPDMTTVIRLSVNQVLDMHNGGYTAFTPEVLLDQLGVWYQFWEVIDYDAGTYQLYIQGPGEDQPKQLSLNTDPITTAAVFRHQPGGQPIIKLALKTLTGDPTAPNAGDPWITDDVYLTMGKDLSNPVTGEGGQTWAGFPVENGLVDTGEWLGWLAVQAEPYIWSYSLNAWIFAQDPGADSAGLWVYAFK